MTNKTIDTRILNYIHSLEKVEQLSVLNYLQKIVKKFRKKNNENEKLLSLAGSINKNDLKKMAGAETKLPRPKIFLLKLDFLQVRI